MCLCKHPASSHQVETLLPTKPDGPMSHTTWAYRACLEFRCGCDLYLPEAE